jgi:hypothetical protein
MNYFNPFQPQQPQFDINQFKHLAATLNNDSINRLVVMARQRGMSEQDIQAGLQMLNSIR